MKKVFQGSKENIIEEIKKWLDRELIEYDFVEIILEILKDK